MDDDVRDLAKFMMREFPRAVSKTRSNERIVDTAMTLMREMKTAITASGLRTDEEGW